MKILFVHRYCGLGGVTVGIRKKYLGLKKLGIEVDFLFLNYLGGKEIFNGLDINIYQSRDNDEIKRIIYKNNYDYILSIDCPEIHGLLNRLPGRIKIICGVHTSYPEHRAYVKKEGFPTRIKCIVTPSETVKKQLKNEVKADKDMPIYVMPNPVEDRFFYTANDYRGSPRVSTQKKYIGWIGRFDRTKNYKEVLRISEKVASLRDDVEFIVVSKLQPGSVGQLFSEINGFRERVNFKWLPFIKHQMIHNFYSLLKESGGCFLSTSRGETQSTTSLESMALRCPIVAPNIYTFKELLENGKSGAIYKSGNIKSAVNAINRVLDDKTYRTTIANNAYNKAKENFTLERVSLKWKELLESFE